jgi:hypothetical protein
MDAYFAQATDDEGLSGRKDHEEDRSEEDHSAEAISPCEVAFSLL